MGQPQVDEDRQLDDRDQDERQRQALLHQRDDHEDRQDGDRIDHLEVVVGGLDHILGAGCLADEHAGLIVLFEDGGELVELVVHRIAGDLVFGVDQQQLPAVRLQDFLDGCGNHGLGDLRADDRFQPQHVLHAVHLLHLVGHCADGLCGQMRVHQQHVGGRHVKQLTQLAVGDDVLHVLRQALAQVVVDLAVGLVVAVPGGIDQQDEDNQEDRKYLGHALGEAVHAGDDGAVLRLLQRLVEHQDQRGQDGHATDHAQQHAFGHDQAQVSAQRETHEAQRREACDGGDGAAHHGGQRLVDGRGHGLLVVGEALALLVVAMPEEDGVVHRHRQLQHGGQCLRDIGNLSQEVIGAQV